MLIRVEEYDFNTCVNHLSNWIAADGEYKMNCLFIDPIENEKKLQKQQENRLQGMS